MVLFVQHVMFVMGAASFGQEASRECAFLIGHRFATTEPTNAILFERSGIWQDRRKAINPPCAIE